MVAPEIHKCQIIAIAYPLRSLPVQRPASETQAHLYCSAKKNCTCGGGTLDPFIETIPPAFASLSTAAGKSQLGVFRSEIRSNVNITRVSRDIMMIASYHAIHCAHARTK